MSFEEVLSYHKCTAEDYAQFYPVDEKFIKTFKLITENENRGLNCLDWNDDFKVWGEESEGEYQRVEIFFVPCNYIH